MICDLGWLHLSFGAILGRVIGPSQLESLPAGRLWEISTGHSKYNASLLFQHFVFGTPALLESSGQPEKLRPIRAIDSSNLELDFVLTVFLKAQFPPPIRVVLL